MAIEVADRLRSRIVGGEMVPGARLVETRLSQEFGISRAPIREAARLLESEGLLSFDPNRGFTVRQLTFRELMDVFDVRICIERHAARLAATRRDPALLATLADRYRAILDASETADRSGEAEADFSFHHAIVNASGNARLLRLYDDAAAELRLILSLVGSVDTGRAIARSHEPLIDAIASGDPVLAADRMEDHIRLFWDEVLAVIHTSDQIALQFSVARARQTGTVAS